MGRLAAAQIANMSAKRYFADPAQAGFCASGEHRAYVRVFQGLGPRRPAFAFVRSATIRRQRLAAAAQAAGHHLPISAAPNDKLVRSGGAVAAIRRADRLLRRGKGVLLLVDSYDSMAASSAAPSRTSPDRVDAQERSCGAGHQPRVAAPDARFPTGRSHKDEALRDQRRR